MLRPSPCQSYMRPKPSARIIGARARSTQLCHVFCAVCNGVLWELYAKRRGVMPPPELLRSNTWDADRRRDPAPIRSAEAFIREIAEARVRYRPKSGHKGWTDIPDTGSDFGNMLGAAPVTATRTSLGCQPYRTCATLTAGSDDRIRDSLRMFDSLGLSVEPDA